MHVLVIGATGEVGGGVVAACLSRGWNTTAVARTASALQSLADDHRGAPLSTLVGSLDSDEAAIRLAESIEWADITGLVVSVNGAWTATPLADCHWDVIAETFERQLRPHVIAARILIPRLRAGATYLAIGGGMADAIFPNMGPVSMAQAAQRNLIRAWDREYRNVPVSIRELLIASFVNGKRTRSQARPGWLTDKEIGEYAADILAAPADNAGPILTITAKDQSGA